MSQTVFSSSGRLSCSALWWYLQYSITLMRIFESTMGSGTGASRPVSSTMFFTVIDRHATSFSTSKISSCLDFSFTDVDSAEAGGNASQIMRVCKRAFKRAGENGSLACMLGAGAGRTSIIRHVICLLLRRQASESVRERSKTESQGVWASPCIYTSSLAMA